MKILILLLFSSFCLKAMAFRERALGTSPRGLLMGNAYTSIADDEYTLFYNPAILSRNKGFSFYPINPQLRSINVLEDGDRFTDLGDGPTAFAEAAFDYPIHIGLDMTPGFKMGNFGFSGLYQGNTNLNLQNQVNPALDVDHRFETGFIAGFGIPLTGSGYTTDSGGQHLAIGLSLKYLKRESVYGSYDLAGYTLLDALSAGEISDVLDALGKVNGQGWGFDVGLDYAAGTPDNNFTMGLSFLDVVTTLQTEENDLDVEVQDQPMQVHFGSSWTGQLIPGIGTTISADIRNLSQQMEFMRRVHLGAEVTLTPAFALYAGVNALDNYSYGLKFNTGLINVFTGFYTEEIGERINQQESDRFLVYLSLFSFDFDP